MHTEPEIRLKGSPSPMHHSARDPFGTPSAFRADGHKRRLSDDDNANLSTAAADSKYLGTTDMASHWRAAGPPAHDSRFPNGNLYKAPEFPAQYNKTSSVGRTVGHDADSKSKKISRSAWTSFRMRMTSLRVLVTVLIFIGLTMYLVNSLFRPVSTGVVVAKGEKRSAVANFARGLFSWANPSGTEELKLTNATAHNAPVKMILQPKGRAAGSGMRGSAKSVSMTWNDDNKIILKRHAAGKYLFCFYNNTAFAAQRSISDNNTTVEQTGGQSIDKGVAPESVFFKFMSKKPLQNHPTVMDPIEIALNRLANDGLEAAEWNNSMHLFVAVGDPLAVMDFQAVLPDDFLEPARDMWPSLFYLDVLSGFKKFSSTLTKNLPRETMDLLRSGMNVDPAGVNATADIIYDRARSFMKKIFEGKETPYLRSEMMDNDQYSNAGNDAIHSVNAIFFQNVLMNPAHPATPPEFFVTFHAPWCGHCKRFESFFKPFAEQMQKVSKRVGFYKMDVTKNDVAHPRLRVDRVPAVYYFKKKDLMRPIPYLQKIDDPMEAAAEFVFKNSDLGNHLRKSWHKVINGEHLTPGEL